MREKKEKRIFRFEIRTIESQLNRRYPFWRWFPDIGWYGWAKSRFLGSLYVLFTTSVNPIPMMVVADYFRKGINFGEEVFCCFEVYKNLAGEKKYKLQSVAGLKILDSNLIVPDKDRQFGMIFPTITPDQSIYDARETEDRNQMPIYNPRGDK